MFQASCFVRLCSVFNDHLLKNLKTKLRDSTELFLLFAAVVLYPAYFNILRFDGTARALGFPRRHRSNYSIHRYVFATDATITAMTAISTEASVVIATFVLLKKDIDVEMRRYLISTQTARSVN